MHYRAAFVECILVGALQLLFYFPKYYCRFGSNLCILFTSKHTVLWNPINLREKSQRYFITVLLTGLVIYLFYLSYNARTVAEEERCYFWRWLFLVAAPSFVHLCSHDTFAWRVVAETNNHR